MSHRRPTRRGIMLIEIIMALILLGVFGLIATRLFVGTIRLSHNSAEAYNTTVRIESAIRALRGDVWGASDLTVREGRHTTLTQPDSSRIEWSIQNDGTLLRRDSRAVAAAQERRWPDCTAAITFAQEGPELLVRVSDTRWARGGEMRLVSQLTLVERMRP